MHLKSLAALFLGATTLFACQSPAGPNEGSSTWSAGASLPDVPLSLAPFENVHVNYKQRLSEPYIFLEHRGDYRQAGARIAELLAAARSQDAPIQGAPFILYFDDPAVTPVDELEARICIAIANDFMARQPLFMDMLPGVMVAYAAVAGPFPEVPRAYPGILAFLAGRNWQPRPPIREIYLVSPADHLPADLVTEVQIPWVPGG
jgi:DNA gyrase inhibitor GyrI